MPRLVADGKSGAKVWHAWNDGAVLHVRFGKAGAQGAHQTKELASEDAARREVARLAKQKIAGGYRDHAKVLALEPCGLVLREIVDPPLVEPDDASVAAALRDMAEGSVSDTFWHGDHAFALEKRDETWTFGIVDRAKPRWRPFEPRVTGTVFPSGFSADGTKCIVSTPEGPACVFDCTTFAREIVAPAGGEIVATALTRGFAALLRREDRDRRLELYTRASRGWSLAHTIECGAQDALVPFAGGRGLVVGSEPNDLRTHPKAHFLATDGALRLLGTCRFAHRWIADVGGRSYFQESSGSVLSAMPSELYAIEGFDEALARASKKKPPQKLA